MGGENMGTVHRLQAGETVQFRPRGNSMTGIVNDGQLVTVAPLALDEPLTVGAVVLAKVNGHVYLHKVTALGADGRVQIGNNKGRINGWTPRNKVYGRLVSVEV